MSGSPRAVHCNPLRKGCIRVRDVTWFVRLIDAYRGSGLDMPPMSRKFLISAWRGRGIISGSWSNQGSALLTGIRCRLRCGSML